MFLGFDDSLKDLKKELKDAGVDMGVVRDWQKYYDKVRKQAPLMEQQYQMVKTELKMVLSTLREMERALIARRDDAQLQEYAKELKKYQGHFNQEFLISKADSDFYSTYESVLKLCDKKLRGSSDTLILQSEIENLIALAAEALEKEWPDFRAMAFYYIERSDKELFNLPHSEKVEKVCRIYENEFIKPLRDAMSGRLSDKRINQVMEVELWRY